MTDIYQPTGLTTTHPAVVELTAGYKPLRYHSLPAPYLPILEVVNQGTTTTVIQNVIKAGMLLAIDPWGYLVPATGYYTGSDGVQMTYTATDVTYKVVDFDTMATTTKKTYGTTDDYYYGTAVSGTKTSTNKLKSWPIGICESDIRISRICQELKYHNYVTQDAEYPVTASMWEIPLIKSAELVLGDYFVPDRPTGNVFSAANILNMGRPISLSTFTTALTIADAATHKAVYAGLTGQIIGRTLDVRRIDNITKNLDYISKPPTPFTFSEPTVEGSAITDYANLAPHLRSAAELTRTINGTAVVGRFSAIIWVGPSVGRN